MKTVLIMLVLQFGVCFAKTMPTQLISCTKGVGLNSWIDVILEKNADGYQLRHNYFRVLPSHAHAKQTETIVSEHLECASTINNRKSKIAFCKGSKNKFNSLDELSVRIGPYKYLFSFSGNWSHRSWVRFEFSPNQCQDNRK